MMLRKILKIIGGLAGVVLLASGYILMDFMNFKDSAVPVLMYHGVGVGKAGEWGNLLISPEAFDAQLRYLRGAGYKILSLEEVGDLLFTNRPVGKHIAITFDDGYRNNYEYAFPILKKYEATATFYLIRNALESALYLNDEQINEMLRAGMKIGSHTMSHSNLGVIDATQYRIEISGSKMLLEQRYGVEITSISYPYGYYNSDIILEAQASGYRMGAAGELGINTRESFNDNPFVVRRIGVYDNSTDTKGFAQTIERAYFVGFLKERGLDLIALKKRIKKILSR